MGIEQEGSIAFRMRHKDADWSTNDQPYRFNPVEIGKIRAWAMKRPDRKVEFHVVGPFRSEITLEGNMPPVNEHGLHVVITWTDKEVQLYLNAQPAGRIPIQPPARPDA